MQHPPLTWYTIQEGMRVRRKAAEDDEQKKYIGRIGTVAEKNFGCMVIQKVEVDYDEVNDQPAVRDYCCDPAEFERIL